MFSQSYFDFCVHAEMPSIVLIDLQKLMEEQQPPIDLDIYVKKLINCRRKVVVVNSILNNAHVSIFYSFIRLAVCVTICFSKLLIF